MRRQRKPGPHGCAPVAVQQFGPRCGLVHVSGEVVCFERDSMDARAPTVSLVSGSGPQSQPHHRADLGIAEGCEAVDGGQTAKMRRRRW